MLGLGLGLNKIFKRVSKNLLKYNHTTWAEWTKDAGVVGDSTGLEFIADGVNHQDATINNTTFKPSTKYGILYEIVSKTMTGAIQVSPEASTLPFAAISLTSTVGMQKVITTSISSFSYNKLHLFTLNTETAGKKIKINDIRIFELPAGSSIEADFTNLTADQLFTKYP